MFLFFFVSPSGNLFHRGSSAVRPDEDQLRGHLRVRFVCDSFLGFCQTCLCSCLHRISRGSTVRFLALLWCLFFLPSWDLGSLAEEPAMWIWPSMALKATSFSNRTAWLRATFSSPPTPPVGCVFLIIFFILLFVPPRSEYIFVSAARVLRFFGVFSVCFVFVLCLP